MQHHADILSDGRRGRARQYEPSAQTWRRFAGCGRYHGVEVLDIVHRDDVNGDVPGVLKAGALCVTSSTSPRRTVNSGGGVAAAVTDP
jgi:hypothetical protein